jgi:hypothetical protein
MSLWHLVAREILFRKLPFALAVGSVIMAVGCLVAELNLLSAHDRATERLVAQKEAETAARMEAFEKETAATMRQLEDDYRKIMLALGFNVLILPKDQKLSDLLSDDLVTAYMPEDYADRLAQSRVVSINHLLPTLQQKLKWPEQKRPIILAGVRGEVPILHADPKKPLLQPVPPGCAVLGHELHENLELQVGDRITLLGREFKVHRLHPPRGNKDDITVWINLAEAQELLERKGQINAILALECNCAPDRLDRVREEIAGILPDTQVIELAGPAKARADARNRAAAHAAEERRKIAAWADEVVGAEKAARARLRQEQEAFAGVLVPLALAGCIVWVGALALANVRERRAEIGILRALGLGRGHVLALFLSKAALVGLLGAAAGYLAGSLPEGRFDPLLLAAVLAAAPVLCGLASGVPALLAARQDPAVVLREG